MIFPQEKQLLTNSVIDKLIFGKPRESVSDYFDTGILKTEGSTYIKEKVLNHVK